MSQKNESKNPTKFLNSNEPIKLNPIQFKLNPYHVHQPLPRPLRAVHFPQVQALPEFQQTKPPMLEHFKNYLIKNPIINPYRLLLKTLDGKKDSELKNIEQLSRI